MHAKLAVAPPRARRRHAFVAGTCRTRCAHCTSGSAARRTSAYAWSAPRIAKSSPRRGATYSHRRSPYRSSMRVRARRIIHTIHHLHRTSTISIRISTARRRREHKPPSQRTATVSPDRVHAGGLQRTGEESGSVRPPRARLPEAPALGLAGLAGRCTLAPRLRPRHPCPCDRLPLPLPLSLPLAYP